MKTFLTVLLTLLAFLPVHGDAIQTVEIPGEGATIELSSDWASFSKPGFAYCAQSGGAILLLKVIPNDDNKVIDGDDLRAAMQTAMAQGAFTDLIPLGKVVVNGVPAYSGWVQMQALGHPAYGRLFLISANRKRYVLGMFSLDGQEDPVFQKIGNSFKFESPPEIPWDWMSLDYKSYIPYLGFAFFVVILMWGFQSAGDLFDRIFPTRFERVNRPRGGGYS